MADEATINSSLSIAITANDFDYRSQPTQFKADVSIANGPTPGVLLVSTGGTNVDLSQLTTPGLCRIQNLDTTNYVSCGIWDGTGIYFPFMELLPGESYVFRLARNLAQEYGTGTGTTGVGNNSWRFVANTASVRVLVEAFDK